MKPIELIFKYTESEYIKAERQYLFASKTITKTSVIVMAIYLPFSLFYFFISSFSTLSIIALGTALFAFLVGCILYFYMPKYKFKQTLKYHEEYVIIFSKDEIKFTTSTINSELKWSIYTSILESVDFYFLIQAPRIYTLIPKTAFLNLEDKQAFEDMALSNLKCTKLVV